MHVIISKTSFIAGYDCDSDFSSEYILSISCSMTYQFQKSLFVSPISFTISLYSSSKTRSNFKIQLFCRAMSLPVKLLLKYLTQWPTCNPNQLTGFYMNGTSGIILVSSQVTFTCLKSTLEALEKGVKYV